MGTHAVNSLIVVFFIVSLNFNHLIAQTENNKSLVATYLGIDSDGKFEFIDHDNEFHLFDDILDDLEIDLYEDDNLNWKFEIFWEEEEVEELNEDGKPTGEKLIFKTIINIKDA